MVSSAGVKIAASEELKLTPGLVTGFFSSPILVINFVLDLASGVGKGY